MRVILHLFSFEFFSVSIASETIWTQASQGYSPGLEYKLTSGVGLCDLLAVFLGDAMTRSLVGDWGGEAGAVNDTGGGNNLALGDKILPSPDLPQRREKLWISLLSLRQGHQGYNFRVHCLYDCLWVWTSAMNLNQIKNYKIGHDLEKKLKWLSPMIIFVLTLKSLSF